jgi:hypothetical protein
MNKELEERFLKLEKRVSLLEQGHGLNGEITLEENIIELDLTLPEADIDGLHFNEQKIHAVFEKKKDGWWHSRDILFLSARNTEDDNSRDILSEYLQSEAVHDAFLVALDKEDMNIEISLPKENEGVKKYNGVAWWYWFRQKSGFSAAYFAYVGNGGNSYIYAASAVGGCAPVFCVA